MKYYSEKLHRMYETEELGFAAEADESNTPATLIESIIDFIKNTVEEDGLSFRSSDRDIKSNFVAIIELDDSIEVLYN